MYPSTNYSPVGVVVVPGHHNVYKDGSCAVVSLRYMDLENPDNGHTYYNGLVIGQYNNILNELNYYNYICYVGSGYTIYDTVQGLCENAFLPYDGKMDSNYDNIRNKYDNETFYTYVSGSSYYYAPSPYTNNSNKNIEYSNIEPPSSVYNALSDFNGLKNTKIYCAAATAQSDWKTANSILINYDSGYSPAACCCWRYHTDGTQQGDWYLPACGELGYASVRINKINKSISAIAKVYKNIYDSIITESRNFWTSTRYSVIENRAISIGYTNTTEHYHAGGTCYVIAFLRINKNGIVRT